MSSEIKPSEIKPSEIKLSEIKPSEIKSRELKPQETVWLLDAVKDVARLKEFIPNKNPGAVQRSVSRIKEAVQILVDNPEAGKPFDDLLPFRDLFIPFGSGNYTLRYRQEKSRVVVVRVRHSREEGF